MGAGSASPNPCDRPARQWAMRYLATTPDLSRPYRQRQQAEKVAREKLASRRRKRKPEPLPKGWEPPF